MSVATRRALYGKMAGDSTLNALLANPVGEPNTPAAGYSKAIFYQQAPGGARFPYVILNQQAGTPSYALGSRAYDNDVWLIKGIDRAETADPVDNIASRLDALLTDGTLSISGKTQLYLRRESDVNFGQVVDGVLYRHVGALYRFIYA